MKTQYWTYSAMRRALPEWQARHPRLMRLETIGKSPEGRELLASILTDAETGPDWKKPAILVDANIHAGEVAGNAAAMHWMEELLTGFVEGQADPVALLREHAVYVIPRIALDGAETYLTTPMRFRSSPRLYPRTPVPAGWVLDDVDGDGQILWIRMLAEDGAYAVDERCPGRMRRRQPGERGGPFYHVLAEGRVDRAQNQAGAWPGGAWMQETRRYGMDFNRNFPVRWGGEAEQPGAGPYPLSEPETLAVARFVADHPNIAVYAALHTAGGVILRQPSTGEDTALPANDRTLFTETAQMGAEVSGYFARSNWQTFAMGDEKALMPGAADDYLYEHYGMLAFTVEMWDLPRQAGAKGYAEVGRKAMRQWTQAEHEANDRRIFEWITREVPSAYTPWKPYAHPDLGRVEIGGVDYKFLVQNPPLAFLPEECRRVSAFLTRLGLTTSRLKIGGYGVESVGPRQWRVWAEVINHGYLPTSGTFRGESLGVEGVTARIFGESLRIIAGRSPQPLGHLAGYGSVSRTGTPYRQRGYAEWVVEGERGSILSVEFAAPRGGMATEPIRLETSGKDYKSP